MQLRRFLFACLTTGAILAPVGVARAASNDPIESITAIPTTQRAEIAAGGTYSASINVYDSGTGDFNFVVSAEPFSVSGENYDQNFKTQPGVIDASKWFTFGQIQHHLTAGTSIPVSYDVHVPAGTGPGGYYAVIFAQTLANNGNQTIKILKRVGVIQYLTVSGATKQAGSIESFKASAIQSSKSLDADVVMKNTGNIHYDAAVKVAVKDIFGNTKITLDTTKIILPSTSRKIVLTWNNATSFGLFHLEGSVSYLNKTEPLPGRYVLMLSLPAALIIGGILLALTIYLVLGRNRRKNVRRG